MYMTGQISPYYLKGTQDNVFSHFLKVSGSVALTGEAIKGYHREGKYYLTKNKEEVNYYKKRANRLLSKASPLMEIYREDHSPAYNFFTGGCRNRRKPVCYFVLLIITYNDNRIHYPDFKS